MTIGTCCFWLRLSLGRPWWRSPSEYAASGRAYPWEGLGCAHHLDLPVCAPARPRSESFPAAPRASPPAPRPGRGAPGWRARRVREDVEGGAVGHETRVGRKQSPWNGHGVITDTRSRARENWNELCLRARDRDGRKSMADGVMGGGMEYSSFFFLGGGEIKSVEKYRVLDRS